MTLLYLILPTLRAPVQRDTAHFLLIEGPMLNSYNLMLQQCVFFCYYYVTKYLSEN